MLSPHRPRTQQASTRRGPPPIQCARVVQPRGPAAPPQSCFARLPKLPAKWRRAHRLPWPTKRARFAMSPLGILRGPPHHPSMNKFRRTQAAAAQVLLEDATRSVRILTSRPSPKPIPPATRPACVAPFPASAALRRRCAPRGRGSPEQAVLPDQLRTTCLQVALWLRRFPPIHAAPALDLPPRQHSAPQSRTQCLRQSPIAPPTLTVWSLQPPKPPAPRRVHFGDRLRRPGLLERRLSPLSPCAAVRPIL
mmetsp:Transcript_17585/g.49973  ORF Transcript_17585/g.49973 Transcript_17585/m.49973 type:complete len:251 (+) Transcript_17585:1868-2620(+)